MAYGRARAAGIFCLIFVSPAPLEMKPSPKYLCGIGTPCGMRRAVTWVTVLCVVGHCIARPAYCHSILTLYGPQNDPDSKPQKSPQHLRTRGPRKNGASTRVCRKVQKELLVKVRMTCCRVIDAAFRRPSTRDGLPDVNY